MSKLKLEAINKALKQGFFTISDYVQVHTALRIPYEIEDALVACRASKSRPLTKFWKKLLLKPSDGYTYLPTYPSSEGKLEEYKKLLDEVKQVSDPESKLMSQFGEIDRDVNRTLRNNTCFSANSLGEGMLERVLKVVCLSNRDIGYCQGMNFVAAILILSQLPQDVQKLPITSSTSLSYEDQIVIEAEVFLMMEILIDTDGKFAMFNIWRPGVPRMKLRVYQFDRLLERNFPQLHRHFQEIQFAPEILVSQWFITLFAYTWPPRCIARLWDVLYYGGLVSIFKVALATLSMVEPILLQLDLEGVSSVIRDYKQFLEIFYDLNNRREILRRNYMHTEDYEEINKKYENRSTQFDMEDDEGSNRHSRKSQDIVRVDIENNESLQLQFADDILKRARSVIVNDALLLQLQELFAMEMITMSQHTIQNNQNESSNAGNNNHIEVSTSYGSASNSSNLFSTMKTLFAPSSVRGDDVARKSFILNMEKSNNTFNSQLNNSYWFQRYADELSLDTAERLVQIRNDLLSMEQQIDNDKNILQQKLVTACNSCRIYSDDFDTMTSLKKDYEDKLQQHQRRFDREIEIANNIIEKLESIRARGQKHPDANDNATGTLDDTPQELDNRDDDSTTRSSASIGQLDGEMTATSPGESEFNRNSSSDCMNMSAGDTPRESIEVNEIRESNEFSTNNTQPILSYKNSMNSIHELVECVQREIDELDSDNDSDYSGGLESIMKASANRLVQESTSDQNKSSNNNINNNGDGNSSNNATAFYNAFFPTSLGNNRSRTSSGLAIDISDSIDDLDLDVMVVSAPSTTKNSSLSNAKGDSNDLDASSSVDDNGIRSTLENQNANFQGSSKSEPNTPTNSSSSKSLTNWIQQKRKNIRSRIHEFSKKLGTESGSDSSPMASNSPTTKSPPFTHTSANASNSQGPHGMSKKRMATSLMGQIFSSDAPLVDQNVQTLQDRNHPLFSIAGNDFDLSYIYESFAFQSFFHQFSIDNDQLSTKFQSNGSTQDVIYSALEAGRIFTWNQSNHDREVAAFLASLNLNDSDCQRLAVYCKEGHHSQHRIIELHRSIQDLSKKIAALNVEIGNVKTQLDEANEWKKRLCDQLQLLMEDANRGRQQKLQYVTETYF